MSIVSSYMNALKKLHLDVARHILKYMKGTQDYRVFFIKNGIQTHWRGS